MNQTFLKINLIKEVLDHISAHRQKLFDELLDNATDPTILKRRVRMLSNLSTHEASLIKKIYNFETDDITDFYDVMALKSEFDDLLNRSA